MVMSGRFQAWWSLLLLWLAPTSGFAVATSQSNPSLPSDLTALEARLVAEPTNVSVLVRTALEYHNKAALGGDGLAKLLKRTKSCLEVALQQEPRNTFARALLGSAIIISAREPFWPGTKIRRVREGLTLMDAALQDDPNDPDARFTRASNNLFLPDLFERKEVVRTDFEWLQVRADRQEFAQDFRQYIFLYHGFAHQRWGDLKRARRLWESGVAIDPGSKVADELRRVLAGHSDLNQINAK